MEALDYTRAHRGGSILHPTRSDRDAGVSRVVCGAVQMSKSTRVIVGVVLFAIGFPIAVVAALFNIVGFLLGSISDIFHSLFVRLYRPDK